MVPPHLRTPSCFGSGMLRWQRRNPTATSPPVVDEYTYNRQSGSFVEPARNVRIANYTLGTSVEATLGGERDTGKCKTSPSRKG